MVNVNVNKYKCKRKYKYKLMEGFVPTICFHGVILLEHFFLLILLEQAHPGISYVISSLFNKGRPWRLRIQRLAPSHVDSVLCSCLVHV